MPIDNSVMTRIHETKLPNAFQCVACYDRHAPIENFLVQKQFPLMRCRKCGLGYLDVSRESSSDQAFDEYWTEVNQSIYSSPAVVAELTKKYLRYFHMVSDSVPNRKFLDVGSGAGISIGVAANLGFSPLGVEPSEKAVALSKRLYSVPVEQGLVSAVDNFPRDFGLLALWDVIEHVSDPEGLVRDCASHLAERGVILLETPDEGALLRRLVRFFGLTSLPFLDQRSNIYYRAHRFYFTRNAIVELLRRCGFTDVQCIGERTMYAKELLKKELYGNVSPVKAFLLKQLFRILAHAPFMANKMVVMAIKNGNHHQTS